LNQIDHIGRSTRSTKKKDRSKVRSRLNGGGGVYRIGPENLCAAMIFVLCNYELPQELPLKNRCCTRFWKHRRSAIPVNSALLNHDASESHARPAAAADYLIAQQIVVNAGAAWMIRGMATTDTPTTSAAATAAPLPANDPRSPENILRRRTLKIAERDEKGKLLPGSVLPNAGRTPGTTITMLARQHTDRAITLLSEVMADPKAPPAAKVAAAQALLDRGWGKAPIQIDLNVRAKFDDFLREVGAAATYEHEHPDGEVVGGE
jgi:hypothetical protein